jgi:hypothetical protein
VETSTEPQESPGAPLPPCSEHLGGGEIAGSGSAIRRLREHMIDPRVSPPPSLLGETDAPWARLSLDGRWAQDSTGPGEP